MLLKAQALDGTGPDTAVARDHRKASVADDWHPLVIRCSTRNFRDPRAPGVHDVSADVLKCPADGDEILVDEPPPGGHWLRGRLRRCFELKADRLLDLYH